MTPRTLRVLGFPVIRDRLAELCGSPLGRERARALEPAPRLDEAARRQQETSEARLLAEVAGGLPVRGIQDIREALHRAAIKGTLSARELLGVRDTLAAGRTLRGFLAVHSEQAPLLAEQGGGIGVFTGLEAAIGGALRDDGTVADEATPGLARIRREQRAGEARLRDRLEQVIRAPETQRMLQDPLIVIRGGRYVVPVRAEFREHFPGVAHDQSASGMTVFMEPLAAVPLGNRLRELASEEQQEIARILARLSAETGAAAEDIAATLDVAATLDLAAAKAALSLRMEGTEPRLNAVGRIALRAARHPLLAEPVPVDIRLGDEFRTLIITGPNTGGKTVTLRTLGLLTLMAQAGLHVPAAPESECAVFPQVYADIGDEQSIEQNLSTFSSHLTAIVEVLQRLAETPPGESAALVLLDEIAAGTDPTEGAALARSLIETLHGLGACTAVTTHYTELKSLAFTHPGVENASVEFDEETLRPTYRLLIGTPGRSNAMAIAARLGLHPGVVERARGYLTRREADLVALMQRIDDERAALARERERLAEFLAAAARVRSRAAEEAGRLIEDRRRTIERAHDEMTALIQRSRRDLDVLLAELKARPSPEAVSRVRSRLREMSAAAATLAAEVRTPPPGAPLSDVRRGEDVLVVSLGKRGIVQNGPDSRGDVEVQVGVLKLRVPLDDLRRPAGDEAAPQARNVGRSRDDEGGALRAAMRDNIEPGDIGKALAVSSALSLRGMTVDDALALLDKYLDEATLAGLPQVTVIHGKGTGALRRAVQEHLAHHPEVSSFRIGGEGEGGTGVTIVTLISR